MEIDFLSILDDKNSIKNETTEEIVITVPILQTDVKYKIDASCKISSNCNTIIKSKNFEILASFVHFSNISFQTSICVKDAKNFSMYNCTVNDAKSAYGAISIQNSQNVLLANVEIEKTDSIPGLFVYQNSIVAAEFLSIHDLAETLIAINGNSSLMISNSNLHHSLANAFFVSDHSCIEISNCEISHTSYPSLYVRNSQCIVRSNVFHTTSENAISLHSSYNFCIEMNTITSIDDTGIRISDESSGVIDSNTICNIKGNGIYCNNSDVQINDNQIFNLTYPSIAITSKSRATLSKNNVHNISYSGICVRGAKNVVIESNFIDDIKESGISISDTDICIVKSNRITNCLINSVEVYNKSKVHIHKNNILHIGEQAFLVHTLGYMKVENNYIEDVKNEMAKLMFKGTGDFINNKISKCPKLNEIQSSLSFYFYENGDFGNVTNDPSRINSKNPKPIDLDSKRCIDHNHVELCMKCKQKDRDCYILDCGHKVYCQKCADSALKNKEKCPLCRFPIVKVSTGFGVSSEDLCTICFENKADSIILPCGHIGVCCKCLEKWFSYKQICPICRVEPCHSRLLSYDI
ncbi:hypothetical protein M9Y10_026497 [Tritrichomonas musculus]|uniref:RING-type domain-containing protein n=1 Tax=Tritrichomonas musculus TaxID=1915356 RepID=A0ABR2H7Q2_9EUKA